MPEVCAAGGEAITAIFGPITEMSLIVSFGAGFRRVPTLTDISSAIGQVPSSLSLAHKESTPLKGLIQTSVLRRGLV